MSKGRRRKKTEQKRNRKEGAKKGRPSNSKSRGNGVSELIWCWEELSPIHSWRFEKMGIETEVEKYTDVPRSVVLKYEFQRCGVRMGDSALKAVQDQDDIDMKGEFMFSWDVGKRKSKAQKVPHTYSFKRDDTFFQNRTNDGSPYAIEYIKGKFFVCEGDHMIEEIYFGKKPPFCYEKTSDGVEMSHVVQPEGDMLFCTMNRYCEFWKDGDQCLFCDFVSVTKDQAAKGELGTVHRTAEQIAETLECALREVKPYIYRHIYFSGGSITTHFKGQDEIEYYCNILNKVRKRIKTWYGAVFQVGPPKDKEGWKRYYDTGIPGIQPNMEVWDRRLFRIICPGKEKYVGYDEYIRRLIEGAEVFGEGRVIPNFVTGVEMAKPFGFNEVDAAVESNLEGFKFLMEHGIMPRTSIWLVEGGSALAGQEPPPLEYYIKLGRGYKELRHKYGYGDNLISMCRACNPQDPLHDWDYAEREDKRNRKIAQRTEHSP